MSVDQYKILCSKMGDERLWFGDIPLHARRDLRKIGMKFFVSALRPSTSTSLYACINSPNTRKNKNNLTIL